MDEVVYSNTLLLLIFFLIYTLYTAILPFQLIHQINSIFDLTLNYMSLINKNSGGLAQQELLQARTTCINILL